MSVHFPNGRGRNLEGAAVTLPEDFEGELNLVLVAFYEDQQSAVDTWLALAADLATEYDGFAYYELPVIESAPAEVQAFIDRGMAAGVPDAAARRRTITLYLNRAAFREQLDLPTDRTVYALLVDGEGTVQWRARGARTPEGTQSLRDAVRETLG